MLASVIYGGCKETGGVEVSSYLSLHSSKVFFLLVNGNNEAFHTIQTLRNNECVQGGWSVPGNWNATLLHTFRKELFFSLPTFLRPGKKD